MNEPEDFTPGNNNVIPMDTLHYTIEKLSYEHRDLHNAYGALMQRSSFNGLMKRNNNSIRNFILTRSWFMGSQKYGAYWTGDNRSIFEELQGSLTMLLQNSISGHPFGGSDIPGFYGNPTDDLSI
jgi:alpha-glucosidase (family GH31 glycosyl hydrolase)